MSHRTALYSSLLGLFTLAVSANSSTITSSTGQVTVLGTAPASVAQGGLQSNTSAYVFMESQLVLTSPLNVDISTPGTYTTVTSLTPGTIDAGTFVDSFMLESQPSSVPDSPGDYRTYEGTITFNGPILGIIVETANLNSTDALLGAPGTTYPPPSDIYSGLDLNTPGCAGSGCGNDGVRLSVNGSTLSFGFVTNYSEDEIRIITAATPEPAGIALTLLGLFPLLASGRLRAALRGRE